MPRGLITTANQYALGYNAFGTDYVSCGTNLTLAGLSAMTVEATIYYDSRSASDGEVIKKDSQFILRVQEGSGVGLHIWTSNVSNANITAALSVGWHHLAMSYNGATVYLLIDGAVAVSQAVTGTISASSNGLYFGNDPSHPAEQFVGQITEVRISNICRYAGSYAVPKGQFANDAHTLGLWRFSEGSGTTTADSSGNGNTGTLTGSPLPTWILISQPRTANSNRQMAANIGQYGLKFDGSQNYVSFGTLGNLGSNLGSGFYCSFQIQTTSTIWAEFGSYNNANSNVYIAFNSTNNETVSNHDLAILFEGSNNHFMIAWTNGHTTINFNDGNKHTLVFTILPSTPVVALTIDGVNQPMTISRSDGGYTYNNFSQNWLVGARTASGSVSSYFPCTIYNLSIGTSASNLYGAYSFSEGSGTSTADNSGNGNTGTLHGSPAPGWIVLSQRRRAIASGNQYGLKFDGSQNYLTLVTMGNFGNNMGNGFYCSFQIMTTQTAIGEFGMYATSGNQTTWGITFNETTSNGNTPGLLGVYILDSTGKELFASATNPVGFNDGNLHAVIMTAIPSTNTITILFDGISLPVSYRFQQTPASFSNFQFSMYLGAHNQSGINKYMACTLFNFQVGTSASSLYGSYMFSEGSGTTTADSSGNGNTGTLTGSPVPGWVSFSQLRGKAV